MVGTSAVAAGPPATAGVLPLPAGRFAYARAAARCAPAFPNRGAFARVMRRVCGGGSRATVARLHCTVP